MKLNVLFRKRSIKWTHRCLIWTVATSLVAVLAFAVQAQDAAPEEAAPAEETGTAASASESGTGAEAAAAQETDIVESRQVEFFEYLKRGGTTMIFLALLSVIGLTFTIERFFNLKRKAIYPPGLIRQAKDLWSSGRFGELIALCDRNPSTLSDIIKVFVNHRHASSTEMSDMAGDIASRNIRSHLQRAYPIAIVATLAPLLGLLGTVIGMIESFEMVAIAGSMGDASVLAGGISKALVTTATGLIIAVPALGVYHYFRSRTLNHGMVLEEQVNELQTAWFLAPPAENAGTSAANATE